MKEYHSTEAAVQDIFGTFGPACANEEILERMFLEGMTGIRLNLSHVMLRDNEAQIRMIRRAGKKHGISPKLLIDLQGPELRIGNLPKPLLLDAGDRILLRESTPEAGQLWKSDGADEIKVVPISRLIVSMLHPGEEFLLDDGKLLAKVEENRGGEAEAVILRGGKLSSRKSITVKEGTAALPALTEADRRNLRSAAELGVTGVMQPFVRGWEDLREVKNALSDAGAADIRVYAKIENKTGLEKLDELIDTSDEIVIARGDLGNAMPLWELPGVQKEIARKCRAAGRPFMVVTQMLASMEHTQVPTRAEVSDIYNAVLDGASSVMVTGETAIGEYPVDVIRYLSKTAAEALHAI